MACVGQSSSSERSSSQREPKDRADAYCGDDLRVVREGSRSLVPQHGRRSESGRRYKAGQAVVTFDSSKQSAESLSKFVASCGYKVKETKVI